MNTFSFILCQLRFFFYRFFGARYVVYHCTQPLAFLYPEDYASIWFSGQADFTKVAVIAAPLERIFEISNHYGEEDWTERREVLWSIPEA
jgi:hypothetical protein